MVWIILFYFVFGAVASAFLYERKEKLQAKRMLEQTAAHERSLSAALNDRDRRDAYLKGVEVARETDAIWKRLRQQVEDGQGTVLLKAPKVVDMNTGRYAHGNGA